MITFEGKKTTAENDLPQVCFKTLIDVMHMIWGSVLL